MKNRPLLLAGIAFLCLLFALVFSPPNNQFIEEDKLKSESDSLHQGSEILEDNSLTREIGFREDREDIIQEPAGISMADCFALSDSAKVLDCLILNKGISKRFSLQKLLLGELPGELEYLPDEQLEALLSALLVQASSADAVESLLAMIALSKTTPNLSGHGNRAFENALSRMDQEAVQALLLNEVRWGETESSCYLLQAFTGDEEVGIALRGVAVDLYSSESARAAALGAYCTRFLTSDEGGFQRETILREVLSPDRLNREQMGSQVVSTAIYFAIEGALANPESSFHSLVKEVLADPAHKATVEMTINMFMGSSTEKDQLLNSLLH